MPNENSVTRKFSLSLIRANGNEDKLQVGRKEVMENVNLRKTGELEVRKM